jgi:hypothetical protein
VEDGVRAAGGQRPGGLVGPAGGVLARLRTNGRRRHAGRSQPDRVPRLPARLHDVLGAGGASVRLRKRGLEGLVRVVGVHARGAVVHGGVRALVGPRDGPPPHGTGRALFGEVRVPRLDTACCFDIAAEAWKGRVASRLGLANLENLVCAGDPAYSSPANPCGGGAEHDAYPLRCNRVSYCVPHEAASFAAGPCS